MAFKVISAIKYGTGKGTNGKEALYFDAGERITAKQVGGAEALQALVDAGAVVDASDYVEPVQNVLENQASGTPSNLETVEGTDLEAKDATPEASAE